jgi:hypothetical protein
VRSDEQRSLRAREGHIAQGTRLVEGASRRDGGGLLVQTHREQGKAGGGRSGHDQVIRGLGVEDARDRPVEQPTSIQQLGRDIGR